MKDQPDQSQVKKLSRRKKLLFVLTVWVAVFLLTETAARVRLAFGGRDHQVLYNWRRNKRLARVWGKQHRDHPYLPYYAKVKAPDVEMAGLRLTSDDQIKPPDVFRIFCLGGSTTYLGYPAELEAALADDFEARGLRLEIVNAADISWTSAESLVNFELRCLHYEPDAIIIYHAFNDALPAFGDSWRPDYAHWRKRIVVNEPLWWDYLPRAVDHSAAFVQFRSWFEVAA